jgi:LmbE family N-acetylglucosaminyl deacetylase
MDLKTIIFSPHLDDAVFSLGGCLLARLFPQPSVINIYTRSRYRIDGLGEEVAVTRMRRNEDREAMLSLGIAASYWEFPDTSLKPEYPDEPSYLNLAAETKSDPSYAAVFAGIAEVGRSESEALFLAPLGMGNHIEHRVTAEACGELLREGKSVAFYEDGSYLTHSAKEGAVVAAGLGLTGHVTLLPVGFSEKERLVRFYASQIDDETLASLRRAYSEVGGERLWSTEPVVDRIVGMTNGAAGRFEV